MLFLRKGGHRGAYASRGRGASEETPRLGYRGKRNEHAVAMGKERSQARRLSSLVVSSRFRAGGTMMGKPAIEDVLAGNG